MKLYRVELERTQFYLAYVEAEDSKSAKEAAIEVAEGISDYEWEPDHSSHGISAYEYEVENKGEIGPGEGQFVVDNDEDGKTVEEWFDERQVEDAGGTEG